LIERYRLAPLRHFDARCGDRQRAIAVNIERASIYNAASAADAMQSKELLEEVGDPRFGTIADQLISS
jgi:hypothetical protein